MNVTIVDYNSGNISSVINSFTEVAKDKVNIEVTSDLNKIKSSDKVVLPGQGSFKSCVDALNNINGLFDTLNDFVLINKKPLLGICVGLQMFADIGYEETETKGLGWISGKVSKIDNKNDCVNSGYQWVKNKMNFKKVGNFFSKTNRKKSQQAKKVIKGNCFKPRFSYINNHAKGFQNFKGLGPSFYNDVMSLTPEKLGAIMAGHTVDGTGMVPCPEGFHNYQRGINKETFSISFISGLIIILVILIFIVSRFVNN